MAEMTWFSPMTVLLGLQLQLQLMTVRYYTAESGPVHTKLGRCVTSFRENVPQKPQKERE